jgi:hypothetical protein
MVTNFHVVEKPGQNSFAQNWLYPPSFHSSGLPKIPPIKNKKSYEICRKSIFNFQILIGYFLLRAMGIKDMQ